MSGWKLIGGLTIGTFQEATDVNKIRHFNQVSVRMGLRCPLLGTRKREQLSIPRAEARAWEHRHRLELAARIGRNALRSHYLNYWGCERRMALSRAFLEDRETVERVLKDRTSKGFLLDADRQELLSAFDLAVRNIANDEAMRARALGVINLLTGGQLKRFASVCPSLPQPCVDETRLKAKILNGHPELALRRGALDEQLGARSLEGRSEVDANLDFAGSASMDYPSGQPGYGFTVSLKYSCPPGLERPAKPRGVPPRPGSTRRSSGWTRRRLSSSWMRRNRSSGTMRPTPTCGLHSRG